MFCGKCNLRMDRCTCPDADERLRSILSGGGMALNWCVTCDRLWSRCKCAPGTANVKLVTGRKPAGCK